MKLIIDSTLDAKENKEVIVVNLATSLDGKELICTKDELYRYLFEKKIVKTSQPSPSQFVEVFNQIKNTNDEALVLTLSSKLSGTYQSALLGLDIVEYDKIYIYDTESTSIGSLPIYEKALESISLNKKINDIINELNIVKQRTVLRIIPKTLDYLYLGGRLSKTKYVFANFLLIKPILTIKNGGVDVAYQSRGFKRGINDILNELKKNPPIDNTCIYLGYTNDSFMLNSLIDFINHIYKNNTIKIIQIGTVVGSHVGLGGVGIVYQKNI